MVAAVGATDRGTLWRASRHRPGDRIVRIVEPRFADGAFRRAVANLGRRQPAGMVAITRYDWTADGRYYIEYSTDAAWRTLAEQLAEFPQWQDRVALLERVCSLFPRWQRSPVHPLGLSLYDVVVVAEEDRWLPWLMPCPAVALASPCDLFGVDTAALAALAPEVVRGLRPDDRAANAYALGTLVAQALGDHRPPPATADEDLVEAQARGVLWPTLTVGTRIPTSLCDTEVGKALFNAVQRCRQTVPGARPTDAEELWSALAAAADPVALAQRFRRTDPVRALDALEWVRDQDAARIRACELGAEIAAERGDRHAELRYLDEAVASAPHRFDLRGRRYEAAWRLFEPLEAGARAQQLGGAILDDIKLLRLTLPEDDTESYHRAAEVHLRCGDPGAAAREAHAALEQDAGDLRSLVLYCRSWSDLGDASNAARTRNEALRRIDRMVETQLLTVGEAQQWREEFARLLP